MRQNRRSQHTDSEHAHHLDKIVVARALRRSMTPAERVMWAALRARALGVRWRRQHVLRGFILDFYAPSLGMVIEIDGPVHDERRAEDARREAALAELGLFIVRFRNREVLHEMESVLLRLRAIIEPLLPRS